MTTQVEEAALARKLAAKLHDQTLRDGHALSLSPKYEKFFSKNDGLDIEDPVMKAQTAIALFNTEAAHKGVSESQLSDWTGGFQDQILPMVRAVYPAMQLDRLVTIQPQTKKNGTIYWMNIVVGQTRGQFTRGQVLFDANVGWQGVVGLTDENVFGESISASAGGTASFSGTLTEVPVARQEVEFVVNNGADVITIRDTGNGVVAVTDHSAGTGTALTSGTINYATGAWTLVFASNLASGASIVCNYGTNNEGQPVKAMIEPIINTEPIQCKRRAIGVRLTMEAMQQAQAEVGIDAKGIAQTAAAQQLMIDTSSQILRELWVKAGAPIASFSLASPSGAVTTTAHYRDLMVPIQTASGDISNVTQRGEATWMVVDQNFLNVLKILGVAGGFIGVEMDPKSQGLVYAGKYNGIEVFKFKFLSNTILFPGASAYGNALLGYKGPDWFDTGMIYAPLYTFYTNGPDNRADLTQRQAYASMYGTKYISPMFRRVSLTA